MEKNTVQGARVLPKRLLTTWGMVPRLGLRTAIVLRSHSMQRIPIIFRIIPHNQRFAVVLLIRVKISLAMTILSFHKFQYVGFTWGNKTRKNSRFRFYRTTSSSRVGFYYFFRDNSFPARHTTIQFLCALLKIGYDSSSFSVWNLSEKIPLATQFCYG